MPVASTLASLACRLDALVAQAHAAVAPGALQSKLTKKLGKAVEAVGEGTTRCAEPNAKKAKKALGRAARGKTRDTLRSRAARRLLADGVLSALLAAVESVRGDLRTLRSVLSCPSA